MSFKIDWFDLLAVQGTINVFNTMWSFRSWHEIFLRCTIKTEKQRMINVICFYFWWKVILGADCGSDHELLIAKYRLKLKKVGNTTRPFRYDLNQIPFSYTVEVTNRFKGLDLIGCLKNCGRRFVTLYWRQWSRPPPSKRNAKRQNDCLRRPYK